VFTLGDLLDEDALGHELLAGGAEARGRTVEGAQSVELESPGRWLDRGWVMLTAGVRLSGNPDELKQLIAELDEAGVAALGFATSSVFHSVPPALLEEADTRGFPVFGIPFETPAREIISMVNRCLVNTEVQRYRRLTSMQRYLFDALADPQPEETVIERLASLVNAVVLVFDAHGRLELASGKAPVEDLWREIEGRRPALREFDAGEWHAVATPVVSDDESVRWLVITSRRTAFVDKLTKPVAQAAAPLLAAMARLGDIAHDQELAVRSALLDELLHAGPAPPAPVVARAQAFGFDFAQAARVIVLRIEQGRAATDADPATTAVSDALERSVQASGMAHMITANGEFVTAFLQDREDASSFELVERFLAEHEQVTAGLGRRVASFDEVHLSLRDAELALARIGSGGKERMLDFERFDLATLLISDAAPERLGPKVDLVLGPLRERPGLYEAVVAYFQHELDVAAAAKALHLHPNSLRYRLARVEELLGAPLKNPGLLATLYVALLAEGRAADTPTPAAPSDAIPR
jgi:purine catabolism regulator